MPIYEYECRACSHEFERLVRTGDTPACPECKSEDLERLISLLTISSESIRHANIQKAKQKAKGVQRDKTQADLDEVREHYGNEALRPFRPGKPAKKT